MAIKLRIHLLYRETLEGKTMVNGKLNRIRQNKLWPNSNLVFSYIDTL